MKKDLLKRAMLFIMIFAIVLFAGVYIAQANQNAATIIFLSGKVDIESQMNGETVYVVPAHLGMRLEEECIIHTSYGSRCEIEDQNGSIIVLIDSAVFKISSLSPKAKKFDLIKGRMLAKIKKLRRGRKFEVVSGTALAGVRGTVYGVENRISESDIIVFQGEVYVESLEKTFESVTVKKGEMVTIGYKGASHVAQIPESINEEWDEYVPDEKFNGKAAGLFLGSVLIIVLIALL